MPDLPVRDWGADAPPPPPPTWKVRLIRALASCTPYRVPVVRDAVLRARRARGRARRRALEARGDHRLSHPALYGMDAVLARHLPREPGVFVEAGAFDGYEQSNTYRLEHLEGWRGVLVEPIPALFREVLLERPRSVVFNCALKAADDPRETVTMQYGALMSTVAGAHGGTERDWVRPAFLLGLERPYQITVPARTLSSLLDEAGMGAVDFMSLDVEGYEEQVLRGLDLDRHAPRFLLVEMHDIAAGRAAIEPLLGDRYAPLEQISPADVLYAQRNG